MTAAPFADKGQSTTAVTSATPMWSSCPPADLGGQANEEIGVPLIMGVELPEQEVSIDSPTRTAAIVETIRLCDDAATKLPAVLELRSWSNRSVILTIVARSSTPNDLSCARSPWRGIGRGERVLGDPR